MNDGSRVGRVTRFLSPAECAAIKQELRFAHWRPSRVVSRDRRDGWVAQERVSESTDESWFSAPLTRRLQRIDRCLEAFVPGFRARRDPWQAVRYHRGGAFHPHHDCLSWEEPEGNREYTFLIFLDTPRWGGSIDFPWLDLTVGARTGRMLWWRNLDQEGRPDMQMTHSSLPVKAGSKTVLVSWARERAT